MMLWILIATDIALLAIGWTVGNLIAELSHLRDEKERLAASLVSLATDYAAHKKAHEAPKAAEKKALKKIKLVGKEKKK